MDISFNKLNLKCYIGSATAPSVLSGAVINSPATIGSLTTTENTVGFYNAPPVAQQAIEVNVPTQSNDTTNILASLGLVGLTTSGRNITFNNTTSTDVYLYVTYGSPVPSGPNRLGKLVATTGTYVWNIPSTQDANYTFFCFAIPAPKQFTSAFNGYTQVEFAVNQTWPDPTKLRDTFDISTVPPGITPSLNNGPRGAVVAASAAAGYSTQQSNGYNAGYSIIPGSLSNPIVPPLPVQTITVNQLDGNSPDAITFANDTAFPKQTTSYSYRSYTVNIIEPIVLGTNWPGP